MRQEVINDTIQEHFLELKTIKWPLEGAHRNRRNKHITVKFQDFRKSNFLKSFRENSKTLDIKDQKYDPLSPLELNTEYSQMKQYDVWILIQNNWK